MTKKNNFLKITLPEVIQTDSYIHIKNEKVKPVDTVVFLGITYVDALLQWGPYIEKTSQI